jgi:DNA primase
MKSVSGTNFNERCDNMELQEILDSVDIVDYISQYVDLEEKNGEYWGISPFREERTPSFSARRETGVFKDFSSGLAGNLVTFIHYYNNVSNYEAVKMIKKYAGIDDSGDGVSSYRDKLSATKVCKRFMVKKKQQTQVSAKVLSDNYMERYENRSDKLQIWRDEGISDESMRFFGVKYDAFSNCLVYPIRNADGKIVNIGGRTLDPDFKAKGIRKYTYFHTWKESGGMKIVYGLYENMESIKAKHEIIIFEGMKSVLLARDYGFTNCGALLTSHCNPEQMKILAKLGANVVFALDKDVDVTADRNIQKLKQYVSVSYIYDFKNLLDAKDSPVDKGRETFSTLYENHRRKI